MKRRLKKIERVPRLQTKVRNLLAALALLQAFTRFIVLPYWVDPRPLPEPPAGRPAGLTEAIEAVMREYYIDTSRVRRRDEGLELPVPVSLRFSDFYLSLEGRLQNVGAQIIDCQRLTEKSHYCITVGAGSEPVEHLLIRPQSSNGRRVALIIDDFGYRYNETVRGFLQFPEPITLSILPGLKYSKRIAREAALANKKVLVHMPMEPLNAPVEDNGYLILTRHDPATIRLRIRSAFSNLPSAVGLNNHQGSKATMDSALMKVVLFEIKGLGRHFIDSRTHSNSMGLKMARKVGCPAAANQLFLDVEDDVGAIRSQVSRMAEIAGSRGCVVAIGHARDRTLEALLAEVSDLTSRGIEFVYSSQVVN